MAFQFKSLADALGLKTADSAITDANLQQANDTIEALQRDKTGAEEKATQALADLATMTTRATTAEASLTTAKADLTKANEKVATLEQWRKEQKATDGRTEDASNDLGEEDDKPMAAFEVAAKQAQDRVKAKVHQNKGK
jgi:chromosome segregation ATPase